MSEEQLDFIDCLEPLNIEARYPSYKERLFRSLTKEYCVDLLKQTKDLQSWIKIRLSELQKDTKNWWQKNYPLRRYIYIWLVQ